VATRLQGGRPALLALLAAVMFLGTVVGVIGTAPSSGASTRAGGKTLYYVNLGDSYAEGYQPGFTNGSETLHGYANRLVADLSKSVHLTLENFGCGGATTTTILNSVGCPKGLLANDGVPYPTTTQAHAVASFLRTHAGHIGLVTISIGGNDFDRCILNANPVSCVLASIPVMKANITRLAAELRAAAGPRVPMMGTTYPDVVLGAWMDGVAAQSFAKESVLAFKAVINPAIKGAYAPSDVTFVDITTATGAYLPLSETTTLQPYGVIPVAVAKVCTDTWFCSEKNIHPTDAGYALIASELATAYRVQEKHGGEHG
jgi:lysophospholipase L1-like esterase